MKNIDFSKVSVSDYLFKNRLETVKNVSIQTAIKKCYDTPRIQNFLEAKKAKEGKSAVFDGIVYDDADIYKIMEGACYILSQSYDEQLESQLNELIAIVRDAQEDDGYITTKHTINPSMKWVCLDAHEMYNFGHMIEAAVAHYIYSNEKGFLEVAIKAADYLVVNFGSDKDVWVPGHQEIELALLKLYRVTDNYKYVELSKKLLDSRGKGNAFLNSEYEDRAVFIPKQEKEWNKAYHQDSVSLESIQKVEGHAVRAMYMYTAMANISDMFDGCYDKSMQDIWNNLVNKNMYITGGIGSTKVNEGFTKDYDLPNLTAYCETCASVGMAFWNSKMYELTRDVKFLDIVEREVKNGILSGLSIDGKSFFYDNPLESEGEYLRSEWFETSCCPTQLMRFIPQIGNYIYYRENENICVSLLIDSEYEDDDIYLEVKSFKDGVVIKYEAKDDMNLQVKVPIGTCILDVSTDYEIKDGLISFGGSKRSEVKISFIKNIKLIRANEEVKENLNKVALMYNGFVYCAEEVDNDNVENIVIDFDDIFAVKKEKIESLEIDVIEGYNKRTGRLYKLIPYFAWNNRGKGKMKVWIPSNTNSLYL